MKRSPDVDLVLRDYFADDGLTAPDYVLDVVESRISRQPQRRSWRLPWRNPMSTPFKVAAGLAAVILVAVVGYNLLPGTPGIGGQPTVAPTPSLQPTAAVTIAPTAGPVFPSWWTGEGPPTGAGILKAGSRTSMSFRPGFTYSVPEGWVNDGDEASYFSLFPDTPANQAEFARSGGLAQSFAMGPLDDPYFYCDADEDNRGETAAEMVAAILASDSLATTGLVDVEIGGLTGKQFDVRLNPEWTSTCPPGPNDPKDGRSRGILLDAPDRGVLVIFVGSSTSADFEPFLAEAMPIIESFEFDLDQ